ncbi:MAG: polysaccharide biosynthesis tyrosine autokinase [Desulfobacteraceae bacterium]|nr:polysaccharide biosynthesis tyrosine autokinase [Desulfobacteraceae bacterium]MBC2758180.1 polysaccharide biosynthesis tyrosine autokinase [Desulfobacteraceae bacterium]
MHREDIPIKDYLYVMLRRKNIILLVFLICLPFILIKAFSATPVYQATTKLLIQKNYDPSFASNYRFAYDPYFLSTQAQLIKSSKVAKKVMESLKLDETYNRYFDDKNQDSSIAKDLIHWFKNLYSIVLKLAGTVNNNPSSTQAVKNESTAEEPKNQKIKSIAKMVRNGITIDSDLEKGDIVNVSFSSTNPIFAADVVNTVASAYQHLLLEMKLESTSQSLEWMKTNADAERVKLECSEKKLREYKKEHDIYTIDDQEAIFPKKITQISSNLTQAQAEVNELESLYQEINRIAPEEAQNLPVVADTETIRELRRQIINKEQEIAGLSKSIGYKHPKMIRANKDLNALNDKLNNEIQNVIQSVKNRYELALQKAKSLQSLLDKTKQNAAFMSDKLIQYEILNRDVEVHRLLYDRLLSRIKEFNVTEQQQAVDVWVVENADIPSSPITKGPKRTILLGIIVSLIAGIGLAFFLEYMDNTVKTSEDAEERLGLPVLGMIPLLKENEQDIEKIVFQAPSSIISEAYKAIRTSVLLSSPDGAPKSILISSMNQGVGKTVTSVNLAISFAFSDKKVLLIDGDMRRARIHKIFNLDNTSGLSTYLADQSGLTILKNKGLDYLDIAPAGPVPPNPSELLSSSRLNKLITDVSDSYDFIIFDSPPMFNVSDAHLISQVAEQTILVTRSGVTTYDAVARAYKMLADINSEMLGLIINAVDLKKQHQYYSKYDGQYGYYKNDYTSS